MLTRNVALILFTDGKDIIVQERGDHAKFGEKYGFIGGEIKKGETPEEAIKREVREEMDITLEGVYYLGTFTYDIEHEGKKWKVTQAVFKAPITPEVEKAKIKEGKGLARLSVERVMRGEGFPEGSTEFLRTITEL